MNRMIHTYIASGAHNLVIQDKTKVRGVIVAQWLAFQTHAVASQSRAEALFKNRKDRTALTLYFHGETGRPGPSETQDSAQNRGCRCRGLGSQRRPRESSRFVSTASPGQLLLENDTSNLDTSNPSLSLDGWTRLASRNRVFRSATAQNFQPGLERCQVGHSPEQLSP